MSYSPVSNYGIAAPPPPIPNTQPPQPGLAVAVDPTGLQSNPPVAAYQIAVTLGTLTAPGATGTPTSIVTSGLTRDQVRAMAAYLAAVAG